MSNKDILETAKEIIESEVTLDESTPEVEADSKGTVNTKSKGEKPAESPSVNTDSIEDEDIYSADGAGAKVNEPEADEDEADENADSVDMKASSAAATQEHMDALFGGEELSEDFRNKAEVIFSSAINERSEAIRSELQEAFDAQLAEETDKISNELSEKLDDYLNYVVKEWK